MINVGQKLNERYKIVRFIGSGGMANVFLADDLILERQVAIKVLRLDLKQNEITAKRFERETFSVSELVHPNIVEVYDFGEEDGNQFLVMEYIEGTDLKSFIQSQQKLEPHLAVKLMKQIVAAVSLAHQHKIIHRDLKSQNILISNEQNAKITDFGIAIATTDQSLTQTNTLIGSVHYLSPEQARGGMATPKTDIYALGIVLYEMLVGRVPFDGESPVAIAMQHFQTPMPAIADMPQALENVVLKATAKDPMHRYASCEEMLADLDTCLHPERADEKRFVEPSDSSDTIVLQPIRPTTPQDDVVDNIERKTVTPRPTNSEDTPPKKKPKPWGWIIAALVVVSLLAYGIVMAMTSNPEPKRAAIPNVINLEEQAAIAELKEAGFDVGEITRQPSRTVAAGHVIETTPARTQLMPLGTKVNLVISEGEKTIVLENYIGRQYDEVAQALQAKQVKVEKREEYNKTVNAGEIISQTPNAGTEIDPLKTTVYLTVSKGEQTVEMPDFTNQEKAKVEEFVKTHGIVVSYLDEESDDVAAGRVIRQSIAAGDTITPGEAFVITLSSGKRALSTFTKNVSIPYRAPQQANSQSQSSESGQSAEKPAVNVEIYIEDANNSFDQVYDSFTITETTNMPLTFTVRSGEVAQYRILVDGVEVARETRVTP